MLENKYDLILTEDDFELYTRGLKNRVYKLLPLREEELEWNKYLDTIIVELVGLNKVLLNRYKLIALISKLEGLYDLEDFMLYRRTIFECLNLLEDLR